MKNTFNGWDSGDEDFFAEIEGASGKEEPIFKEKEKKENSPEAKEEEEKEEKPEAKKEVVEDLFGETGQQEEEEEEEEEEEHSSPTSNIILLSSLKERGLVDFELEEDEELTEELAETLLEDSYEKQLDNRIKDKLAGLADEDKGLIEYILKGGKASEFISGPTNNLTENLDMNKESDQETVMRIKLKEEGNDQEFIDSQIEFLKDSGNLAKQATRKYGTWLETKKQQEQAKIREIEQNKALALKKEREGRKELSDFLNKEDNIKDLGIPIRLRKELPSYMSDKSVVLANGVAITPMQEELFYALPKNKKAMVQLAGLLKNRNEDGTFNMDFISRKEKTNITKEIKKDIRRVGGSAPTSSGGGSANNKSLAELLS